MSFRGAMQSRSTQLYIQYSESSAQSYSHGWLCRHFAETTSLEEQTSAVCSGHFQADLSEFILRPMNLRRDFCTPVSFHGGWLMATLSLRLQHFIRTPIILLPLAFVLLLAYTEATSSNFYIDNINPNNRFNLGDPCYHGSSKAQFCQPQFRNLALGKRISATSTCDVKDIKNCGKNNLIKSKLDSECPGCPLELPKEEFLEEYLTDHFPYKKTCWASKSFQTTNMSHVNLTISFKKKHIIYYLSLMDCGEPLPDNLEIMKSVDHGLTWQQWHLFSKNCERDFGIQGKPNSFQSRLDSREVVCTMLSDIERDEYGSGGTISFSTIFNRGSFAKQYDSDPLLIDWMTATDIKIVMRKLPNSQDLDRPLAFSNIDIGGRCFCNGHASRCIERDGRQVCDCKHGTEGADCERCRSFWVDMPWLRATTLRPSECKPCKCNNHSFNCQFSPQLYKTLDMSSGGKCLNCLHHTTGHHCHECKETFFRDDSKNMTDKRACKVCNCHPLGSLSNICNRMTGNCQCKPGVEGDRCDQCKRGYLQTNIQHAPCQRIPIGTSDPPITPNENQQKRNNRRKKCDGRCKSDHRKLTHLDYCLREWALVVRVSGFQRHQRWMKVVTQIEHFFKCRNCVHMPTILNFWIKREHWRCRCPRLQRNHQYLIITRDKRHRNHVTDLTLDKRSIVWEWEKTLRMKIQRYENFLSYNHDGCKDCDCIIQKERERKMNRRQTKRNKPRKSVESKRKMNAQVNEVYSVIETDEDKNKQFGNGFSSLETEVFQSRFRKRGTRLALKRSSSSGRLPRPT